LATTDKVGIGYLHGFTDWNGRVIMHNGILMSGWTEGRTVDSYALADPDYAEVGHSGKALLQLLQDTGEVFANIFSVNTEDGTYTVVRRVTGQLHTDGKGNFSSAPIEGTELVQAVPANSYFDEVGQIGKLEPEDLVPSGTSSAPDMPWASEEED
jgi:hypothetical protein